MATPGGALMPFVRCPHCKLPVTADEAESGACPVCAAPLDALPAPTPPETTPARLSEMQTNYGRIGAGVVLLFLAIGGPWLALYQSGPPAPKPEKTDPPVALAPRPEPAPVEPPASPPPVAAPEPAPSPEPPAPKAEPVVETPPPPAPVAPPTVPETKQPASEPTRPPTGQRGVLVVGDKRHLFLPDSDYTVPDLQRGTRVLVSGKVKMLQVGQLDGATLETADFEAEDVLFTRKIDHRSRVHLRLPGGNIEFRAPITGQSQVEIDAPGGKVLFTRPLLRVAAPEPAVAGESDVQVTARDVDFRTTIAGTTTHVIVALTKGGHLRFHGLDGQARLHYRKTDAADPEPRIDPGWVRGGAQFRRLD